MALKIKNLCLSFALSGAFLFSSEKNDEPEAASAPVHPKFAEKDTDGDGAISWKEFSADSGDQQKSKVEASFDRFDTDGDGLISQQEAQKLYKNPKVKKQVKDKAKKAAKALINRFRKRDLDSDGKISKEEFKMDLSEEYGLIAERVFDSMDTDEDGFVTKQEFRKASQDHRKKNRKGSKRQSD